MNRKEKQFMKWACKAQWRKIDPRDWFRMTDNYREISYWTFWGYIDRSSEKNLKKIRKIVMYNRNEDKKQCRRNWYIADYFDNLFY